MKKLFNRILLPVNMDRSAPLIVEKAISMANEFRCDVHLLYNHVNAHTEKKINDLLEKCRQRMGDGLYISGCLAKGAWFPSIKQYIITHRIDLVVIPRRTGNFFNYIDMNRLARETGCPVLSVTQNTDISQLKNIVVPINDFLPVRKLTAATYIARRFNAIIHLMGYNKNFRENEPGDSSWVSRAYQLLKDNTRLRIHRSPVYYGNGIAGNTLTYARQVEADLIVVNPGKESIYRGWPDRFFETIFYKKSHHIPVLIVARQYLDE